MLCSKLEQSAFATEVHSVNGKGEDSGVVFSEMQGCENRDVLLMLLWLVEFCLALELL